MLSCREHEIELQNGNQANIIEMHEIQFPKWFNKVS